MSTLSETVGVMNNPNPIPNDTTATNLPHSGYEVKNAKTFIAKFLPCTNSRGARVKVFSPVKGHNGNPYKPVTIAWDYAESEGPYEKAFRAFLLKHENYFFDRQAGETFEVTKSWFNGGYYFTARVAR